MGTRHHDEEPPRSPRAATFSVREKRRENALFKDMVLPSASLLGDLGATAACEVLSCVRPFSSLIRSHVQNHGPHVGIITWAGAREIERAEPWSTCGHHHLGWGQGDRMCRTMVHTWASSPGLGPGRSHVQNHGPHVGIITWAGARGVWPQL